MDFSAVYLVHRLFYRVFDFFHHWYVDGSRSFAQRALLFFRGLDQGFAVRVTLEHFFEPLYKDYSVVGRVLGVIFRTGRVFFGGALYIVFGILFLAAYLIWIAIPIVVLFLSARNVALVELWETIVNVSSAVFSGILGRAVSAVRDLILP